MRPSVRSLVIRLLVIACLVMPLLAPIGLAADDAAVADPAVPVLPPICAQATIPGADGNPQQVLYCIPTTFNGTLLIYAHGYVYPQAPLALPWGELSQATLADGSSLIEALVGMGYGFATTSYSKNGWAVGAAEDDLNALRAAVEAGLAAYGKTLDRTLLVGASEGGLITVQMLEKYPTLYQGGLELSGPIAGGAYQFKYVGDFFVVFDAYFPDVFDWAMAEAHAVDAAVWMGSLAPTIAAEMTASTLKTASLMSATGAARDRNRRLATSIDTAQQVLAFWYFGAQDGVETVGGLPYDNTHTTYRMSLNDAWLNRAVERVEGDLDDPAVLAWLGEHYEPTGQLQVPMVVLHNTQDAQVPFRHAVIYGARAIRAGAADKLAVIPVRSYGHGAFTGEQVLAALQQLLLMSGVQATELEPYRGAVPEAVGAEALATLEE